MSKYWSPIVKTLEPYVPGEQPRQSRLLKLNTNENPYPPSPRVNEAIAAAASALRLYPDPESSALRRELALQHRLESDQVFLGNGSDEVLAHVCAALLNHARPVCFPDISYSFYPVWCQLYGISYRQVPLRDDFSVAVADFPQENGGILLPNPNAPTGIALPLAEIELLLQTHEASVVVIDEAYVDFGAETAVSLIARYPNLLVVQTLSKSRSLAGLRVGMAFGQAPLIEGLNRVKNSFNSYPLDNLAQAGALAALQDVGYFEQTRDKVVATREQLATQLRALDFEVLPSASNFLFVRHPRRPARELFASLRDRSIVVRYFDQPRIDDFLRITVGSDRDCAVLLDALQDLL